MYNLHHSNVTVYQTLLFPFLVHSILLQIIIIYLLNTNSHYPEERMLLSSLDSPSLPSFVQINWTLPRLKKFLFVILINLSLYKGSEKKKFK